MTQDRRAKATDGRAQKLLGTAGELFQSHLWEPKGLRDAQRALDKQELEENVIRDFGVGFAPMGPNVLLDHLRGRGFSDPEIVGAGLATLSARGRPHAYFRSRVMFPVRDPNGGIVGFAGLATHLGPSWSLWVTSPDTELYRRSEAVYGLDLAAPKIARSKAALLRRDSIEVLRSHQEGDTNAVTVHSGGLTRAQIAALAGDVKGGMDALELDLPPGLSVDSPDEPSEEAARPKRIVKQPQPKPSGPLLEFKKVAIVIATALAAINVWTLAPLIAVWVGSQNAGGQVLSLSGVFTVLLVMAVLAFLLAWLLAWLHAKYDELTGRPALVGRTSPWGRRMRGELSDQFRTVYGLSAPERVVAACVLAALLTFEVWFFFFAGSSIG